MNIDVVQTLAESMNVNINEKMMVVSMTDYQWK